MKQLDSHAAEMLPIRLILSCTLISVIILLVGCGIKTVTISTGEHQIEEECQMLEASLSTMIESGTPRTIELSNALDGTKRIHTFSLPDSLLYLSFGGDPDKKNDGAWVPELLEDGSVIVYQVDGGSKHILWLPSQKYKFREGAFIDNRWTMKRPEQSFIIHTGGKITIIFELIHYNHSRYILIHASDDIELEEM